MIKLIIFDLDGVLVDTKDIHYEALNMSLKDSGIEEITYEDHVKKFDGKSTLQKLDILKCNDELKTKISKNKQIYTKDILSKYLKIDKEKCKLFKLLKEKGFKIHVASNAIRSTVIKVINDIGVSKYVDHVMSNEDVINKKPNPEIYLKCILFEGLSPKETLIIEDSYIGRKAAYNSGSNVCAVNNSTEVTSKKIFNNLNNKRINIMKWKDDKLNVLIPMAGEGTRFKEKGYSFPKPIIDVNGKPMIQVVIESLNIDANYTFVVKKEHNEIYNIESMLKIIVPNCNIVIQEGKLQGAVCSALLAEKYINNDNELLIANSDQYIKYDSSDFMYSLKNNKIDGGILTFTATHPKWSFVKVENNIITEVAEKNPISNNATTGIYYWKKGSDFVKYSKQMIDKNITVNNEFYIAPVYNEAIKDGKLFKQYKVDEMRGLGTPEDLEQFLSLTS